MHKRLQHASAEFFYLYAIEKNMKHCGKKNIADSPEMASALKIMFFALLKNVLWIFSFINQHLKRRFYNFINRSIYFFYFCHFQLQFKYFNLNISNFSAFYFLNAELFWFKFDDVIKSSWYFSLKLFPILFTVITKFIFNLI